MPIAEINDGRLHYEVVGDGPPLVLLLPQSRGPIGLQGLIDGLSLHHTVITYDQRGTGNSSLASDIMSMASQAEDVVGLLNAVGVERAALLCHSTGCGIGISVAAMHAERTSALILASPWTYADPHLTTMQNLRIAAARALDPVQYAHFNAALLYPPEYRRAHQAGFQQIADSAPASPHDAAMIARRLEAILAFDARPLLPNIQAATLVTAAKDDQLMPSWFAAEAAELITGSQFVELDGGGHMLLETRAADIIAMVVEFLSQARQHKSLSHPIGFNMQGRDRDPAQVPPPRRPDRREE